MGGVNIRVLKKTSFDFTQAISTQTNLVVVARQIDTSKWREAILLARLHNVSWVASSSIDVVYGIDPYTDEDPSAEWKNFLTANASTAVTFTQASDTFPTAKSASLTTPFGPLIWLGLRFKNGTGGQTFTASLSADLNLKGE